ncbi:hypothetical protein FIBSPDRAFT_931724 [Athelia psychrophila]|uniref:Ubiquitin-like domain-containing protein n=1 Tax=Athelia psychrophila TaxID=1759441 RepID=A0A166JWV3_9AGAM|nr:hypothetical protein FIBSPDRAFT_931724 [Fibularhizoctonia sp. CBS 109695]
MDLHPHWLFALLAGIVKWIRDTFKALSRYARIKAALRAARTLTEAGKSKYDPEKGKRSEAVSKPAGLHTRAEGIQQMDELEEGPTEGVEHALLPQDSNVPSLAPSDDHLKQMVTENTASTDAIMDLGEHSESVLFVGTAECERRIPEEVEERGQIDSDASLAANDVLHIVPPSQVPTVALEFVREDGDEVVTPLEMQDDIVNVSIDDRIEDAEGSRIEVAGRLDQTLSSFKELLLSQHSFHCAERSLILIGRELKDDEQTLGDLGFVEGCTVHAVAAVQFSVTTLAGKGYKFALKATTLISDIRKLLREVDADVADQDNYAFSLDGVHSLRDSDMLWDLNIYSGTTLILKGRRLITLSIQYFGLASNFQERLGAKLDDEICIDDSASLEDLRVQILSMGFFNRQTKSTYLTGASNWVACARSRRRGWGTRTWWISL